MCLDSGSTRLVLWILWRMLRVLTRESLSWLIPEMLEHVRREELSVILKQSAQTTSLDFVVSVREAGMEMARTVLKKSNLRGSMEGRKKYFS